ncbi:MAG: discoidin domain-containing protein, partial [Clostridium sp.]
PKVHVKVDKTDVTKNEVELTINDFANTQDIAKNEVNENLATPGNFSAPEDLITPRAISLVWDEAYGATSYDIEIDGTIFKNIKINEYTDTNVLFDTVYNYRVRSVNADGYSEWSEKISPRTSLDPYRNVPQDMTVEWTEGHYGSEEAVNAVDNNDNSQFHSAGSAIDKPFVIDMKKAYSIEKLELLFRKSGNGSVKRAEIYSSLDGVTYEKVFSNAADTGNAAWSTDGEVKAIEFNKPVKARYFKIVTKESIGNFMAMREFRPYKVDGSNGQVVGDWNNSGMIEEGDLVFLENYAGLTSVDSDWDYVSMADLNGNKVIDAYDISYVASKLEDGVVPSEGNMAGEILLVPSKNEIKAGETFTLDIMGAGLSDVNAFSVEIPLDSTKYEVVTAPESTIKTAGMKNLSKVRTHSDGKQDIYAIFSNVGNNVKVEGTDAISRVTLKAKTNITFDMKATHAFIVDSKLNSKEAIANIVSIDAELPAGKPTTSKIVKESITLSGDETQLQTGMGLSRLVDGTTNSDDASRMDLKWVTSPDQVEKGTLPFEMTFDFDTVKELDNITIYNRMNSSGTINSASMKKVKAVGYLNGEATDLGEVADITTATTVYNLEGQSFDKIVITALESHKDMNTLAINEIEFYEKQGVEATGIEFAENTVGKVYENKLTPVFAQVLPDNANNQYYRVTSEDTNVVEVIRIDSGEVVSYYLRGVNPGTTNIVATTADGKLTVKHEITVGEGLDKSALENEITIAKTYKKLNEIYTTETYAELVKAIEEAEQVLANATTEVELSNSILTLRRAVNALVERDSVEADVIDFNKLTAIDATSEADKDYKENAVDGDESSIWHSGYQSVHTLPVSITVKLDGAHKINQIDYMPRQNGKNGHVTEYKIETSLDNENWTEARTGSIKTNNTGDALLNTGYNPIRFNEVEAEYVRFTALKTLGDTPNKYASIAELKFYGQQEVVVVDKTELSNVIVEAEKLVEAEYTAESFAAFTEALNVAKEIVANEEATQVQVDGAKVALETAISGLVKVDVEIVVSKVSDLKSSDVTSNSVTLNWAEPSSTVGLTEYVIYKDGKEFTTVPAGTNTVTINELRKNTNYGFKVTAKYSNEKESKPQSINVRTKK